MNDQEVFDKVCKHLLTQNVKAKNPRSPSCMYHAANGLKCAVGCLIPDELYSPKFEGKNVVGLIEEFPSISDLLRPNTRLLVELQSIHDKIVPEYWRANLLSLASKLNLEFNA